MADPGLSDEGWILQPTAHDLFHIKRRKQLPHDPTIRQFVHVASGWFADASPWIPPLVTISSSCFCPVDGFDFVVNFPAFPFLAVPFTVLE